MIQCALWPHHLPMPHASSRARGVPRVSSGRVCCGDGSCGDEMPSPYRCPPRQLQDAKQGFVLSRRLRRRALSRIERCWDRLGPWSLKPLVSRGVTPRLDPDVPRRRSRA